MNQIEEALRRLERQAKDKGYGNADATLVVCLSHTQPYGVKIYGVGTGPSLWGSGNTLDEACAKASEAVDNTPPRLDRRRRGRNPGDQRMSRQAVPQALRGIAAITEMLNMIGDTEAGADRALAKVFCDNEIEIREAMSLLLRGIAKAEGDDE